jgi:hypothetical protein
MSKKTDIVLEDDEDENHDSEINVSNPIGIQGLELSSSSGPPANRRGRRRRRGQNNQPIVHVEKTPITHNGRRQDNDSDDDDDIDDDDDDFDALGVEMLANPRKILSKGMRTAAAAAANPIVEDDDDDDDDNTPHMMPDPYDAVGNQMGPHGFGQIPPNQPLRYQQNYRSGGYMDDEDDDDDDNDDVDEEDEDDASSVDSDYRRVPAQRRMSLTEQQRRKRYILSEFRKFERRGITVPRHFDMSSTLDDLELEYNSIKRQIDLQKSIRFQRRMLMACVTGVEFLNHRYDPFNLRLDGWSENVMEDIHDYDDVFEELYDKYHEKVQIAPELRLMFMVGGSAFWYHLSHTMFQSAFPDMRQNPEFMENMTRAAASAMKAAAQQNGGVMPGMPGMFGQPAASGPNIPPPAPPGRSTATSASATNTRADMRPPSNSVTDILNRMGNMGGPAAMGGGLQGASIHDVMPMPGDNQNNNNNSNNTPFAELDFDGDNVNENVKNITVQQHPSRRKK